MSHVVKGKMGNVPGFTPVASEREDRVADTLSTKGLMSHNRIGSQVPKGPVRRYRLFRRGQ